MVFSSLIFIYAFLPLCLISCALARTVRAKNTVLLIFSLLFYAWGEPVFLLVLILMTLCDFSLAKKMEATAQPKKKKLLLIAVCIIDLGLLGFFKYTGFFLSNVNAVFGFPETIPEIVLPIGISFYTFQLLSYAADVYRGEVKAQKNFFDLLLYSSLFFQCIAGPIVRYSDVESALLCRKAGLDDIVEGIKRFSVGLAKKAVLANTCAAIFDKLVISDAVMDSGSVQAAELLSSRPAAALWCGMLIYMLQIYLDFSAYSDMAIGMGLATGFRFKENFEYPYCTESVTDFWRRWHISLGSFFRDYVYIPLGGNRKGTARTYLNLFIVWLLTGAWHGASWNFILWGLYFFVFLAAEKAFLRKLLKKIPSFFRHFYLVIVVYFGWILFKFTELSYIPLLLKGMFMLNGNPFSDFECETVLLNNAVFFIIAILSVTPVIKSLGRFLDSHKNRFTLFLYRAVEVISPVVLLFVSTLSLAGNAYNPFIYFRF